MGRYTFKESNSFIYIFASLFKSGFTLKGKTLQEEQSLSFGSKPQFGRAMLAWERNRKSRLCQLGSKQEVTTMSAWERNRRSRLCQLVRKQEVAAMSTWENTGSYGSVSFGKKQEVTEVFSVSENDGKTWRCTYTP